MQSPSSMAMSGKVVTWKCARTALLAPLVAVAVSAAALAVVVASAVASAVVVASAAVAASEVASEAAAVALLEVQVLMAVVPLGPAVPASLPMVLRIRPTHSPTMQPRVESPAT